MCVIGEQVYCMCVVGCTHIACVCPGSPLLYYQLLMSSACSDLLMVLFNSPLNFLLAPFLTSVFKGNS